MKQVRRPLKDFERGIMGMPVARAPVLAVPAVEMPAVDPKTSTVPKAPAVADRTQPLVESQAWRGSMEQLKASTGSAPTLLQAAAKAAAIAAGAKAAAEAK